MSGPFPSPGEDNPLEWDNLDILTAGRVLTVHLDAVNAPGLGSSSSERPFQRSILSGSVKNANTVSGLAAMRTSFSTASRPVWTTAPCPPFLGFRFLLQHAQTVVPELVQERPKLLQTLAASAIVPACAVPAHRQQVRVGEHGQVLRHGRARHLKLRCDLPGGELVFQDHPENRAAPRFSQCPELGVQHEQNIANPNVS